MYIVTTGLDAVHEEAQPTVYPTREVAERACAGLGSSTRVWKLIDEDALAEACAIAVENVLDKWQPESIEVTIPKDGKTVVELPVADLSDSCASAIAKATADWEPTP